MEFGTRPINTKYVCSVAGGGSTCTSAPMMQAELLLCRSLGSTRKPREISGEIQFVVYFLQYVIFTLGTDSLRTL